MALIVEDGSIVKDAESYVSVLEADKYHDDRGMTSWSLLSVLDKERALRRATDFMVARFRTAWKGAKVKYDQALDWPRQGAVPDNGDQSFPGYGYFEVSYTEIPKEVRRACCELALKAAAGPLADDVTQKVIQETVGPITTKYDVNSPQVIRYSQVDMMLGPLLSRGSSAMVKLVRC